jgi:2-polyprenyl-6-methoxyphenol hydroxylase-like FAD-dependent oxidoreductase
MLKTVDGWDETYRAVVKRIPEAILIDFKLLWRDPVKKWVSDNGRVVIVGDAAHPHLATSGQGAAQAIEDGATLGALLDRAGKAELPSALRAFEKLR